MRTSLLVTTVALSALLGGAGVTCAAADAAAKPAVLPPLIVEDDAPRLKGPPATAGAKLKDKKSAADNSPCYVCHVNLMDDSFALRHEEAGIGCVKCHGDSPAHVADEANLIPPEVMFPSEAIAAACGKCHSTHNAPATAVIARWKERCATSASAQSALCTDCHGNHRFAKRAIVWDKKTGKLLSASAGTKSAGKSSGLAAFGKALRGGMTVEGKAEYRQRPITVECRAKLDSADAFNILVASDTKASAEHWSLYSVAGSGTFAVYQPGRGGVFDSEANICDSKWHYVAAIIESERVRMFVDGQLVKELPATPLTGEAQPGDLAFGKIVEGGLDCDGAVNNIRISRGVREINGKPAGPLTKDAATLGLWNFNDKSAAGGKAPAATGLFARSNLATWCIVPFDAKKRGPEARAQMLEKLGFKKFAYDWRFEHIPTFDAEVAAMKRHGVEMTAWWFPGALNSEARAILDCIKRNNIHPQLWVMLEAGPHLRLDKAFESTAAAQAAHVARMVAAVKPIAAEAAKLGCQVALYNHGGWFGIPENQIAIIKRLKRDGVNNVGMVYTQHHGHGEIDRFEELFPKMKPYLLAVSLNGMIKDGDLKGSHDLGTAPLGQGDQDLRLLRIIKESGWTGPVGVVGETASVDVELRLQDHLDGLDWLVAQLDGKPAGPKPQPRSWRPPAK